MGINANEAAAILALKRAGQVGGEILCLGRPELFVGRRELQRLNTAFKLNLSSKEVRQVSRERFADAFLERCGFAKVISLDASAYEGASIVHDLNLPVPPELEGQAGFLYDGGTAEHVFDVAEVLGNVTKLLRVGGVALISCAANGQCGHGFYQFSPELFYRFFEANGFVDVRVYLFGLMRPSRWFLATDPRSLRKRIQFMTSEPVQALVVARKAEELLNLVVPLQSDYADLQWQARPEEIARTHAVWRTAGARWRSGLRDRIVYPMGVLSRHMFGIGMPALWRRSQFRPVDPFIDALM
ncbi:MAG: hypothetical protein JO366_00920 [Methylobacteriaceae bacterium]|nr:hypothetical protein [Methylobacteriaceae bacterium]